MNNFQRYFLLSSIALITACGPDSDTSGSKSGEWVSTWGAVMTSGQLDKIWTTTKQQSAEYAKRDVLGRCESAGATDCSLVITYSDQCVTMVQSKDGSVNSIFTADDPQTAQEKSMGYCKRNAKKSDCDLIFTECTQPRYRKY
ncbi:hypothetical protein PSCICN_20400 [Pseudomonas cichorii]|uniref:DUF4189 domain-containing protein n=1 Tax=Pseudomonas cichorii TaxID=36746 RepID=UPI0019101AA6|nr:DUF4189 domain-containing protein [Pseudomonas cichorii]GFM81348.1 hypothetical protein PSCICN_20400 [Pseudomonas cichorii]